MDRGNEFLAELKEKIIKDYSITIKPITSRSPQAKAILESVHQIIDDTLRTFKVQNMVLDDENPCDGILVSIIFALRATEHTTTQFTHAQFIFGCDSIINRRHNVVTYTAVGSAKYGQLIAK